MQSPGDIGLAVDDKFPQKPSSTGYSTLDQCVRAVGWQFMVEAWVRPKTKVRPQGGATRQGGTTRQGGATHSAPALPDKDEELESSCTTV